MRYHLHLQASERKPVSPRWSGGAQWAPQSWSRTAHLMVSGECFVGRSGESGRGRVDHPLPAFILTQGQLSVQLPPMVHQLCQSGPVRLVFPEHWQ